MPIVGSSKHKGKMKMNNNDTKITSADAFVDPFDFMTNRMLQILDNKGFIPSIFEASSTAYPYDHFMVMDEKTNKIKQQVFQIPVAGYFKDEIHVSVKNDNLKVEITPTAKDTLYKKYIHKGIKKGKVFFEWYIKGVKASDVKTKINNGILTIEVDCKNIASEYEEIEIK